MLASVLFSKRLPPYPSRYLKSYFNQLGIVKKIIYGYALAIIIASLGTTIGLFIGNHYQKKARGQHYIAEYQKEFILELENIIGIMRLHPQRLVSLMGKSIWFDYEASKFNRHENLLSEQLTEFEIFILENESQLNVEASSLIELLRRHRQTTQNYAGFVKSLWQQLDVPNLTPAEVPRAREELLLALNSPTANQLNVDFERLSEGLLSFKAAAKAQQKKADQNLRRAEFLAIVIISTSIVLSVMLAVVLALLISHSIARPLKAVTQVAQKVTKESNFELRTPVTTLDEVGYLAISLNQLIQWVGEYTHELEKAKCIADAANRAKSEFLANMSHELRTPLNGILGYAQILQQSDSCPENHKKGIAIIYQCGNHLLNLINDVLDLSKIEARKLELFLKPFHLPSFLGSICEIFSLKAQQKQIAFIDQIEPISPQQAIADEKRLRQVLINLLGNAIKFTDRGSVTFKVRVIQQGAVVSDLQQPQLSTIRFEIIDTGVGISSEQLEKIFLPFEQVGNSDRKAEGTGLGLTISQQILQLMGSTLHIESQPNQGSMFSFDLDVPLTSESAVCDTSDQVVIGFTGKSSVKILIVDDKWENRAVILNSLAPLGFIVEPANNGIEGLEKAVTVRPDLIITDLIMPLLDGFEMIRRLRKMPQLKDTVIFASSASVFDTDQQRSKVAGSNDFLAKPIQLPDLLQKLETHLGLTWVYRTQNHCSATTDESIASPTQDLLNELPRGVLATLTDLAKRGRILEIEQEALKLKQLEPKFAPVAENLILMAREFHLPEIKAWLKNAGSFNSDSR